MTTRNEDEAASRRLLDNLGVEPHYGAMVCVLSVLREVRMATAKAYRDAGGTCGRKVDCGSTCWLPNGHTGACSCQGDVDGPGSCPA